MVAARHFLISGLVQGVGYRFFTREAATREGLGGWVRNVADGRVEVEAEGDLEALERLERALHQGPPGGRVDSVIVTELAPAFRFPLFRIESTDGASEVQDPTCT